MKRPDLAPFMALHWSLSGLALILGWVHSGQYGWWVWLFYGPIAACFVYTALDSTTATITGKRL